MSISPATRTDYARPYRPLAIKLFNALGGPGAPRGFVADRLLTAAQKKTGLTEISDAPLMEPLSRLCTALNTEARLSPFGKIVQRERLMGLLVNRLRLDDLMRRHPEILEQPDPDVLLIAGLARTGTTLLQRSLAADPNARSLPSWEALNPAPMPSEGRGEDHLRKRRGRNATRAMAWLAPDFQTVHPVAYDAPEEDILLLDLTMMSQTAEAVTYVPSYSAWLETQDHTPAYEYLRNVLKTLLWLKPGTHWVLKSPHHAEQLRAVFDVFPKATIIQTHRDPLKTMASCASLMAHAQGLSCDRPDPMAIARHWMRKSILMAGNASSARASNPGRKVVDIYYQDLISNPGASISKIYEAHGSPLTETGLKAAIAAAEAPRSKPEKHHAYALSDFGLTGDQIRSAFADHMTRFNITDEEPI
ncbi:MAG: sulfotransferase [Pseudomonadota bacterium]